MATDDLNRPVAWPFPVSRDDMAAEITKLRDINTALLAALEVTRFYVEVLEKHLHDENGSSAKIRAHAEQIREAIAKAKL
jgi:hypothetical protein